YLFPGFYKHCANSIYCPSCIRQVYLNLFGRSLCLASVSPSEFDCTPHHFSSIFTAPDTAGTYNIKMEEKLAYKCETSRTSSKGSVVGTVFIEEPPSIANKIAPRTVFTGDSFILNCSANGYPTPVVRWFKDGSLIYQNTSLAFPSLNQSDTGLYMCNASNIAGSDTYEVQLVVRERRPILQQRVLILNASDNLLANDAVTFKIFLTHDALSSDHAWNVVLVWILPHYARFLSHVPKKNITNPYPGEYRIKVGKIELTFSREINITVQIDPESKLSTGGHFLSIPTYIMYEKRMSGDANEMFVGSIEAVTVNFTVKERIDRRVKIILGMTVRGLEKMIFAKTSDNQCHMFSVNGHFWSCIVSEEWEKESSSEDFAHVVYVPPHLKSETPQDGFIFTKKDGTVSYGGIKCLRMFKTLA
ncbi:unnamed protein product, partial [Porites evermanni]